MLITEAYCVIERSNKMKIKEVCVLTGLTERTIRYYEEEKLISPKTTESNGRTYREYSSEDASQLKAIAELRKAGLSIEEIRTMMKTPKKIETIMSAYSQRLATEVDEKTALLAVVNSTNFSDVRSIFALAAKFSAATADIPLPRCDAEPNFSRFESESAEDKEEAFKQYQKRQQKLYNKGQYIVVTIAIINILISVFSPIVSGFTIGSIFSIIFDVILSACLIMGVVWVKWLFIITSAFASFVQFMLLYSAMKGYVGTPLLIVCIISLVYRLTCAILLFANKGVEEYLYSQKHK